MKKIILLLLPIVLFISYSFDLTDFYTSITKIEYVNTNKTLKISSKVNADHLQQALGKNINASDFDAALSKYVTNNVKVNINDNSENLSFSSKNLDGNIVWIYYEITGVDKILSISIKNTMLMSKYPDQQNYIKFIINGQNKSTVCKKGSETGKVTF